MTRRPPRSTLFPSRRSSDLPHARELVQFAVRRGDARRHGVGVIEDANGNAGGFALERSRSEEHTSELQSHSDLVCRLLLEKKKTNRAWHKPESGRTTSNVLR